jgi:hypothetical protein
VFGKTDIDVIPISSEEPLSTSVGRTVRFPAAFNDKVTSLLIATGGEDLISKTLKLSNLNHIVFIV